MSADQNLLKVKKIYIFALSITSVLILAGCSGAPATGTATPAADGNSTPTASASMTREEAVKQATSAFKDFGEQLKAHLQTAISEGGPVNAVKVCHEVAPKLAEETSSKLGFQMGRSSHRLRNPSNAPLTPVEKYLSQYAKAGSAPPVEAYQDGTSWVVVAPIVTQPMCLTCHGDPKTFSPELTQALKKNYPQDQATGFAAGDLRGVFWAKLP